MDGARWSCFITIWVLLVTVGAEDLPWWLVQPSGSAFGGGGNSYQRPAGYVPVQSASNNGYGAGLGTNNGFSSVPSSTNNGFGAVPQASVGANNGFGAVPSAGVGANHGFGTVPSAGIGANNGFGVVPSAGVGTSNGFSAVPSSPNNGYGAGVGANNGFGAVPQVGVSANNGFGAVPSADLGANNVFGPVHNADGHQGVGNNGFGAAAVGGNNGGLTPDYQATVLVAGSSLGGLDDDAAALASVFPQQDPTTSTSSGGGGGDDASSADVALFEQSSYDPCFCPDGGLSCLCVVYYQCINGSISTSGYNLLDDRLSKPKVETCPGVQKCCREPLDNEIEGTPSPEPPPFTPEVTPPTPGPNPVKSGCGVRRNPSPNYDNTTNFSEFPWMLIVMQAEYLGDGSPPVDIFKCGGSLIHPQVALTAAHCVHQILPSDLTVRAGEWDAQSSSEPLEAQDRKVSRVIKHPGFEKETLFNDIALLVLDSPMKEAPNVDVTCLPQPTDDYNGARCIATGWGTPRPDLEVFQTTLKKVEVPIVDRASCQKRLRTTRLGRFFQLHKSFICAGGEPGVDTCKGDGGGPLFCPWKEDPSRYIQVGVVSWGIGCGGTDIPAVYSSLAFFRDWVDDTLLVNAFENIAVPPPNLENEERIKG